MHGPSAFRQWVKPRIAWPFVFVAGMAFCAQVWPGWRDSLVYDRIAIGQAEWWRLWTGHLVHFGWTHFLADTGLLFFLGAAFAARPRWLLSTAIIILPLIISAGLFWFDPGTTSYGGLSAMNLGLLIWLAAEGWQRNWRDWFWPAVLLVYVSEIGWEYWFGGSGGGMIRFDVATISIATRAHLFGAAGGLIFWWLARIPVSSKSISLPQS